MAYTTIDNSQEHFNVATWTGNGSSQSITGLGFQPDIILTKCTSHAGSSGNHAGWKLTESSNGTDIQWYGEEYGSQHWEHAMSTETDIITAFGSDGFTVGSDVEVNQSGRSYVAYCWKVDGGTTETIPHSQDIHPVVCEVQKNTTSKTSIVRYQGSTSYGSISHGLGERPDALFAKSKVYGSNTPALAWNHHRGYSNYNQWSGGANYTGIMNAWPDTSKIYYIDITHVFRPSGANTYTTIAFSQVQGFSRFGSYEGDGNATNGPFIYLGFKPAFVMIKNVQRTADWVVVDSKREPNNPVYKQLLLSSDSEESSSDSIIVVDFCSNGFKIRDDHDYINNDGELCVYYAWAEKPFVSSEGVPLTAQ